MEIISKNILSPDGDDQFCFHLDKQEGVGLLTTTSKKNYLILDSIDFWYDVIQKRFPRKLKCKCGNYWFTVRFDYVMREQEDEGDRPEVDEVRIFTECTICFIEKKQAVVDIDFSPSDQLLTHPVTYCPQPKIRYDLKEIICYWTIADLKKFITFMAGDLRSDIYCWFWQHSDDKKYVDKVSLEKALQIVSVNHRYFSFFFTKKTPDIEVIRDDDGNYVKGDPWRQQELVAVPSPMVVDFGNTKKGLLFYIYYCTQYIEKGVVIDKSKEFRVFTDEILKWIKANYINARGRDQYDNPEEHRRLFGDKYAKKQKKLGKPG